MNQLKDLENKKLSLEAMLSGVSEQYTTTKNDLESSFFNESDTDKLSQNLAQIKAKRGSLSDAILKNKQETEQEAQRVNNNAQTARLDVRKAHIRSALETLEAARPKAKELSELLQSVLADSLVAGSGINNVLPDACRKVIGEIVEDCRFMSTSLRSVKHIKAVTIEDDLLNLSCNLRGDS